MFTNLIESDSHLKELKRRSSFVMVTITVYSLVLFGAGVASIYAYDAQLEAQSDQLVLLNWVPPIKPVTPEVRPATTQPIRHTAPSNAPVDRNVTQSVRTAAIAPTDDPRRIPDGVGTKPTGLLPVRGPFALGNRNVDPPSTGNNTNTCVTCTGTGTGPTVKVDDAPPPVLTVKPPTTLKVSQGVLTSKVVSLPQPAYPSLARSIRLQGAVTIQILVSEDGKVLSAQPVSGHPMLQAAARDAAMRARFTATKLSGQPVKVQGLITYNFVLQ